jgi:hypothetical protein
LHQSTSSDPRVGVGGARTFKLTTLTLKATKAGMKSHIR